ncbi:MAG: hypothetical protein M3Y33_06320, partial [Actinomycetota bacterium]|nr:hypothetical protein [Actinomycetota bacterium]
YDGAAPAAAEHADRPGSALQRSPDSQREHGRASRSRAISEHPDEQDGARREQQSRGEQPRRLRGGHRRPVRRPHEPDQTAHTA